MKPRFLSKEWQKIAEKGMPQIEIKKGDTNWLLELLGWKKE